MIQDNTERLIIVAEGLDALLPDVVFVGGAVTALYATKPASPPPRPSVDVDCVIQISSRIKYDKLERQLESLGFQHDTSKGAPVCRWMYHGIQVDVMPTDPDILGFANQWSAKGFASTVDYSLQSGLTIRILSAPYFLASKLEALKSRGGDLRLSGDFDDVVYLLDNRDEILAEVMQTSSEVRAFVKERVAELSQGAGLQEAIEAVIGFGSDRRRAPTILRIFESLARP